MLRREPSPIRSWLPGPPPVSCFHVRCKRPRPRRSRSRTVCT